MIIASPEMMMLLQRNVNCISTLTAPSLELLTSNFSFYGENVCVDPYLFVVEKIHFVCTSKSVTEHLSKIWDKFIGSLLFFYCPACEIMYYMEQRKSSNKENTRNLFSCGHPTKEIQTTMGLRFFDVTTLLSGQSAMLGVPREELVIQLL